MTDLPPPPPEPQSGAAQRGGLLTGAWRLYRSNFGVLVGISSIVVVPLSLFQSAMTESLLGDAELTRKTADGRIELGDDFNTFVLTMLFAGVIALLISQLLTGATTRAAIVATAGGRPSIGESYRFAMRVLGPLLLISLLSALVVVGGFLLLVIPGIVFAVRLVVAVPALVTENVKGTEALRRSWRLVKGDGWNVFGALLVAGLLSAVVTAAVVGPLGKDDWIPRAIGTAVAATLTSPFLTCVIVLAYLDLRARKEGLDRDRLAQELGGEPPPET